MATSNQYLINSSSFKAIQCQYLLQFTQSSYKPNDNDIIENPKKYQSLIGSEMYAILCIEPDLIYMIIQISQFSNSPSETHYAITKQGLDISMEVWI